MRNETRSNRNGKYQGLSGLPDEARDESRDHVRSIFEAVVTDIGQPMHGGCGKELGKERQEMFGVERTVRLTPNGERGLGADRAVRRCIGRLELCVPPRSPAQPIAPRQSAGVAKGDP